MSVSRKLSIVTSTTCGDFWSAVTILSNISSVTPVCQKKVIAWIVVQIVFKNVPGPKATVVMLELYGSASKIVQYSS